MTLAIIFSVVQGIIYSSMYLI